MPSPATYVVHVWQLVDAGIDRHHHRPSGIPTRYESPDVTQNTKYDNQACETAINGAGFKRLIIKEMEFVGTLPSACAP